MPAILRSFLFIFFLVSLVMPPAASAQESLCDPQYQDCRAPLINLIRTERVGIDVAFWYMADLELANELVKAFVINRVPVRVLMDQRANSSKPLNATILQTLRAAGIPMREKYNTSEDILHFKMMLFDGQNMVEFSKANYSGEEFTPYQPYVNYVDEAIFFTNDTRLTDSFRRRFDDRWIDTTVFRNYWNITGTPTRRYSPTLTIDPSMNFPPTQDFLVRLISRLKVEPQKIDAIVYRDTEYTPADAMIAAVARNVPARLISEPTEYRNPARLWDAKHIDRMYMGGVQIKMRQHEGLTHEGLVVLYGLGEVIFGSANWTTASAAYQDEHNYFYNPTLGKPWFFQWFVNQFESKWNDTVNYVPFQPLPPNAPVHYSPQNGASVQGTSVTLTWDGGNWSHLYDIYCGTTPNPPLVATNQELGSPTTGQLEAYTINNLLPGTVYYWRIVDKTWAQQSAGGPTWSFTTAGTPPDGGGGTGSTPYGGVPIAVPGTFQAENFDDGGQYVAYYDTNSGNRGGAYRTTDVDIAATTDAGGGYYVGWTKAGEWLKYTVNVLSAGDYTLETRVASLGTGASFHVEVDGVDRSGKIVVPDTGGWEAYQTLTTPSIPLSAGRRVLRVVFDTIDTGGAVGGFNWFRLTATIVPPPSGSTPYGGKAAVVPGTFQAENFDDGGQGVAYYDVKAGNSGGLYRSTDVDIAATTDAGGGYYVGWTKTGEWLKYTVSVAADGIYTLESRVANMGTGSTFHVEVDGSDRTGSIAVPSTGGWQIWDTIPRSGIPLSTGQHVIRVVMDTMGTGGAVAGFNWFRVTRE